MKLDAHVPLIRVLMLEDSALDAELILVQLASAGIEVEVERVWTREAFVQALTTGAHEIILADHVLPNFDGDSALRLAAELKPDVPFIFVSGSLTEELAVKALTRGARDYVVKERLQRLPEAITRALRENHERADLHRTRAELRESQEALELFTNSLPALVGRLGSDHRVRLGNDAFRRWFGIAPAQLVGMHLSEVIGAGAYATVAGHMASLTVGTPCTFKLDLVDIEARHRRVQMDCMLGEALPGGAGRDCYLLARDITGISDYEEALRQRNASLEAQLQAGERELQIRESRLESIFESSIQQQVILSLEGVVLDANKASLAAIMARKQDVVGREFADSAWFSATLGAPERVLAALRSAAGGDESREELELQLPTGIRSFDYSYRPILDQSGEVVSVLCEAGETTERRRAEHALQQAQKIEAVGQLTGGIAHDFNNILTVISGNVDYATFLLDVPDAGDRSRRALENAMKGVTSAAALTSRLLTIARKQPLKARVIDLGEHVAGMGEMLARALGELVQLEVVASPERLPVEIDPGQFEAALINLAVNARDAMPGGGRLVIEASDMHMDAGLASQHGDIPAARYVMLRVRDTGHGMAPETMSRVFEPFFTTKDVGKGTGLGLSMVYGFVKQSGGHVLLDSKVGKGTVISLLIPYSPVPLPELEGPSATVPAGDRSKTILVAEDNEDVRAYTVDVLRHMGYRVLEAHDGLSAMRLLERPDVGVDLLFSDIVMPRMSGWELAQKSRALRKGLPILFTSGYPRDIESTGAGLQDVRILAKPFTRKDLATAVRLALGDLQVDAGAPL